MRTYRITDVQLEKLAEDAADLACLRNSALSKEIIQDAVKRALGERLDWIDRQVEKEKMGRMVRRGLVGLFKIITGLGGSK